jgi:hypothetical protein
MSSQFAERSKEIGWERACGESFRANWFVEALCHALVEEATIVYWNSRQQPWDKDSDIDFGNVHFRVKWHDFSPFREIEFDGKEISFSGGEAWGRYAHFDNTVSLVEWEDWFHRARQEVERCNICHCTSDRLRKDCKECQDDWLRLFGNEYQESFMSNPLTQA